MTPSVEWKINNVYQMMLKGEISYDLYQIILTIYADELLENHGYDENGHKVA